MHWVRAKTATGQDITGVLDGDALHLRRTLGASEGIGDPLALDTLTLLPPVVPGKFIGLWNNFHAAASMPLLKRTAGRCPNTRSASSNPCHRSQVPVPR